MNRYCRIAALLCILLMAMAACKQHSVPTVSTYSFTNTTSAGITFDIYETRADYDNFRNRLIHYFIAPGATLSIPLEVMKTFWIDWYSADYRYNNWVDGINDGRGFSDAYPASEITVSAEDDHYDLRSTTRDTSRAILLNGTGISSTWQAVINNIPVLNGSHRFLFRKDFTGQYTFTTPSGTASTQPIRYNVTTTRQSDTTLANYFGLTVFDNTATKFAILFYVDVPFTFSAQGRDTLMLIFSAHPDFTAFPARRQ